MLSPYDGPDEPHMGHVLMSATETSLQGRLVKRHSHFYYVEVDGQVYECMGRGLLKKGGQEPIVGDFVTLDSVSETNKTARIVTILPRKNALNRPSIANSDGVLVVCSLRNPDFDPAQLDRYLTHIEIVGLEPVICVTKTDLAESHAELEAIHRLYREKLGYEVLMLSVFRDGPPEILRERMQGRIFVLAGPSGSGKSSLLNTLNPDLQIRIGDVSDKIGRGRHTTRHTALLPLGKNDPDTLIADTPGFTNLKFDNVLPAQIEAVFRDFAPLRKECAFSDCLHIAEEGCKVRDVLENDPQGRYKSYRALIAEAQEYEATLSEESLKEERGYKTLHRKGQTPLQILRLKEKDRDAARNTRKQKMSQILHESEQESTEIPDLER